MWGVNKQILFIDHSVVLGYYASEEKVKQEIDDIAKAIGSNKSFYELKHCAKMNGLRIVED